MIYTLVFDLLAVSWMLAFGIWETHAYAARLYILARVLLVAALLGWAAALLLTIRLLTQAQGVLA
jgi:hypothetical protein